VLELSLGSRRTAPVDRQEVAASTQPGGEDTLSKEDRERYSARIEWSPANDRSAAEPRPEQQTATLVLRGEIDAAALPEVRSLLDLLVERGLARLRIDLADALFVSVSVMQSMVDATDDIAEVVIEHPSVTLRRIFALVDTERRLSLA
jgi:anti-anti-sigma regulatory factor